MSDRKTAKKLIKLAKNNPHLYSQSDVLYAKLIKKASKCANQQTVTVDTKKNVWYNKYQHNEGLERS